MLQHLALEWPYAEQQANWGKLFEKSIISITLVGCHIPLDGDYSVDALHKVY